MLRFFKNKNVYPQLPAKQQAVVLPINSPNRSIEFITDIVEKIRPDNPHDFEQAELRFKALLYQLVQDKSYLFSLRKALLSQFLKANIVIALTENGILSNRGFIQELTGKLKHKLLPESQTPDNFLFVINKVFYRDKDYLWVEGIDKDLWGQFFEILGIQINLTEPALIKQFHQAFQLLSYRVASLGVEKEITHRFDNFEDAVYPFLEQGKLINEYLQLSITGGNPENKEKLLIAIDESLHNCNQSIQWIKEQRSIYGISLSQTYILTRLQQQIDRLFIILDILDTDNDFNTLRFVEYFTKLVHNEKTKNSVREFLGEHTSYLAYQIAEHGGRTGRNILPPQQGSFGKCSGVLPWEELLFRL